MEINDFDLYVEDLLDEKSGRSTIIIGASQVDELLYSLLAKFLLDPGAKKDELLEGDNPLSTFSAKIKVCKRLGLYSVDFEQQLNLIRKIRNDCAHQVKVDINKAPMKDRIDTLHKLMKNKESYELVISRYFPNMDQNNRQDRVRCCMISCSAVLLSLIEKCRPLAPEESLIKISDK